MNGTISVLLADDHPMFLEGVKNALQQFDRIQVIAECTDGLAVEDFISNHIVDVAVLDINMPGYSGLELAKIIHQRYPHTKVVFLTMYHPSAVGAEIIFSPHAAGYVLKNSGSRILFDAITAAVSGKKFIDPKLQDTVAPQTDRQAPPLIKLSSREKEIIKLIVEGKANREIADVLYLSELTIKTHRKNVYQKLGVNNVAGLLHTVRKLGLTLL